MSDQPKPKMSQQELEAQGEYKLWKRTTSLLLLTGEEMEVSKVLAVTRYAILVSVKGRDLPILIQKHTIAYSIVNLPKKEQQEP